MTVGLTQEAQHLHFRSAPKNPATENTENIEKESRGPAFVRVAQAYSSSFSVFSVRVSTNSRAATEEARWLNAEFVARMSAANPGWGLGRRTRLEAC